MLKRDSKERLLKHADVIMRMCGCVRAFKYKRKLPFTHQIGGDNEGHVHNSSVKKSDRVGDVDTIPRCPLAHFNQSVRFQFEQIEFDVGPPAFAKLHRSRYTAIFHLK